MKFKYEELKIWQLAIELIKVVYSILKKFRADEKYDLCSQSGRSSKAIPRLIAEGFAKKH
jgi:four helix bundle protein